MTLSICTTSLPGCESAHSFSRTSCSGGSLLPGQEEPRFLLSPDAFYYHSRWLYERGQITAEALQKAVHWLDAHDNAPPCDEEL
jgi:hypothetical protein